MRRFDALRADAGILRAMLRGMPRAPSQAQQLDAFYGPQVEHYDRFRERLLHGREQLVARLDLPRDAHVVELGGGTGRNAEFFGARLDTIARYDVVDLCAPMLEQARARSARIPQLNAVHGDATRWQPEAPVDAVIVSYALTMIPNWRAAIVNAMHMLKPGGVLGVVDFYVSTPTPLPGCVSHGPITRRFWPAWFGHDGVRLDDQLLPTLCRTLPRHELVEARAPVPYLPGLRVPYFVFTGHTP